MPLLLPSAAQDSPNVSQTAPAGSTTPSVAPEHLSGNLAEAAGGAAREEATGLRGLLQQALDSNPYFSAGFGLMALGVGAQVLRRSAVYGATIAQRRLLVSLEISSKDPSYLWFLQWMSQQSARQAQLAERPLRGIEGLASRIRSHELAVETKYEQRKDGSSTAEFSLVPGPGTHYFRYQNAWFQVKRERATNMLDLNSGTPWETVHLTTLSRDRNLFSRLLDEARKLAQQAQVGRTVIYTAWGAEWRPFGRPREKRLLESVVLDEGVKERVVEDVKAFMGRGRWYSERGIPYRRGYLLHGPPGSGKSSFIQALAGELDYNICVLNLSERGLTDDKLNHLLANAPERSVVLLEDIDAAFSKRQQTGEAGFNSNVTFSGLLNALDGVASSTSQRILFLTTNHLEQLDPALIRPGRVDLKELIDDATPYQARELFTRFYADEEGLETAAYEQLREQLVQGVQEGMKNGVRVSMAALQGHFIRNDAKKAVAEWPELRRMAVEDAKLRAAVGQQNKAGFASSTSSGSAPHACVVTQLPGMLVQLTPLDTQCDRIVLFPSFVVARASSSPPENDYSAQFVNQLKEATDRMLRKWPLLAGVPSGTWHVDVPDDIEQASKERSLFGFTAATQKRPYDEANDLENPLPPISARSSGCLPEPNLSFFRPSEAPNTLYDHEKRCLPLLHVHITLFPDVYAVGISLSHGIFDSTGIGLVIKALNAELHGLAWEAPPLFSDNPLLRTLDNIARDKQIEAKVDSSLPILLDWRPASSVGALFRFFTALVWEKLWGRFEQRYLFIRQELIDALAQEVKKDVQKETDGEGYVSTGDIFSAWLLRSAHSREGSTLNSVSLSPVYCARSLLDSYPDAAATGSFSRYPHNLALPYQLTPSTPLPIAELVSAPLSSIALHFRRGTAAYRNLPMLRATWLKLTRSNTTYLPYRDWPELPPLVRRFFVSGSYTTRWIMSNQTVANLSGLSFPGPDGEDLPLLAFYFPGIMPISMDHVLPFQQVGKEGVLVSGVMRMSRWESLLEEVKALEARYGVKEQ
ncbi:hypothetical protein JCM11641_003189 [Rhodosporidiobolus odoratus]